MRHQTVHPFKYFVSIAFVLLSSSIAFATADGPDYLDIRNIGADDQLTIHLKPAASSEVIREIPTNATCLKNLGCKGGSNWWCKIVYQGTTGWINGRFLKESIDCPSSFSTENPDKSRISSPEVFTKQLLVGKTLYNQEKDAYVKLSFQKSNAKLCDGTIVFTFLKNKNCLPDTIEALPYRLKDGKVIYYANDGSTTRLTLQKVTTTSWIILAEEDIDGDDQQLNYGPAVKNVYTFKSRCE